MLGHKGGTSGELDLKTRPGTLSLIRTGGANGKLEKAGHGVSLENALAHRDCDFPCFSRGERIKKKHQFPTDPYATGSIRELDLPSAGAHARSRQEGRMGIGRWLALHTMAEQGKVVGGQLYSGGSCTYALRQDEKRRASHGPSKCDASSLG